MRTTDSLGIPLDAKEAVAFALLGEVVHRLSGIPYMQYVIEKIIQPLALENTAFTPNASQQALKATGRKKIVMAARID